MVRGKSIVGNWATSLAFSLAVPLSAMAQDFRIQGRLFEIDAPRTKPLFTFTLSGHTLEGKYTRMETDYRDLDGVLTAHEKIGFRDGRLQSYAFEIPNQGEIGKMEIVDERMRFSWNKNGEVRTEEESVPENLIVGPTIVPFLRENRERILAGESLRARLAVLDRMETIGFRFTKVEEKMRDGRAVVMVRMRPSSFVVALVVKPLDFLVDKETFRLLEYRGRTLPLRQETDGTWTALDVDAVYDP